MRASPRFRRRAGPEHYDSTDVFAIEGRNKRLCYMRPAFSKEQGRGRERYKTEEQWLTKSDCQRAWYEAATLLISEI